MHKLVTRDVEISLLKANRELAASNSALMRTHGVTAFDILGSIGSGKTLIIERLIDILKENGKNAGCISGDVAGEDDFLRFKEHTPHVVNVNTGKECHLDAHLVEHALEKLSLDELDYLFIENVGNLVCPADFPLGSARRVVVISTTEGDDMARKHPVIMGGADLVVLNKITLADAVGMDPQRVVDDLARINPALPVLLTDARSGQGMNELARALDIM